MKTETGTPIGVITKKYRNAAGALEAMRFKYRGEDFMITAAGNKVVWATSAGWGLVRKDTDAFERHYEPGIGDGSNDYDWFKGELAE